MMHNTSLRRFSVFPAVLVLMSVLFVPVSPLFAADVYYLPDSKGTSKNKNQTYSFKQRLKDLFDFSSKRPMEERSGKISGSIRTQGAYNRVTGNKAKSFLQEGRDYLAELRLNLQEKLKGDYHLEGQLQVRKTDDQRMDDRKDVRIKQSLLQVSNSENLFILGDFYGELSPFTLGSSVEGFSAEIKPADFLSIKQLVARQYEADQVANKFQRNIIGTKLDAYPFRESAVFSEARFGFQMVTNQDDSATATRTASFADLDNQIFSLDGDLSFIKLVSVNYEVARSQYLSDEDTVTPTDKQYGNAFHIAPQLQLKKTLIRHTYNYIEPTFYSENGSAYPDKIQYLTTLDHRFSERVSVSLMENYYRDNLRGSTLTKRTTNDAKTLTVNWLPLAHRPTFRTQFNTGYAERTSDEAARSVDNQTVSFGMGMNDRWKETDWGVSYDHRSFDDRADTTRSEYQNRYGVRAAREYSLFGRRLYLSLNPGIDTRNTKTGQDQDIDLSMAFSGQYDLEDNLLTRFGYNVMDSHPGAPGTDYFNARSFAEIDWSPGNNKDRHVVFRYNLNRYLNDDNTLNYKESQAVLRYICNF